MGRLSGLFRGVARLRPARLVLLGYLSYVVLGWLALCLPFAQKGEGIPALDNLFMTVSAVSTTGLATVSVSDRYTWFGQAVLLVLIQLGGIGYMTLGSFLILARKGDLSPARVAVERMVFSLPESFRLDSFLKSVIRYTIAIEAIGAAALYVAFRNAGVEAPLWKAVFHSVSAFCTAGFGLYNDSFESFAGDFWINAVLAVLALLGAIGFIVMVDVARMLAGKADRVTLTTKIILWGTFGLTVVGTLLLFLGEPVIRGMSPEKGLLAAFFQCMTAQTTVGFNTIGLADLSKGSVLLLVLLMIVGSSPSGTGGGVKITTLTAILGVMRSAARGDAEVRFWGRAIPLERVWTAVAGLGFYGAALLLGAYLLEITESAPFEKIFFEAASALGTVGLSMGITPSLSVLGKILVVLMMFCGRVGPLTLGIAFLGKSSADPGGGDKDLAV
jgi:trk system potassium uptake protein TrkH